MDLREGNDKEDCSWNKDLEAGEKAGVDETDFLLERAKRLWWNELPEEKVPSYKRKVLEVQGDKKAAKRSTTLNQGSTLERKFNELISALHNMIGVVHSMQRQLVRYWGVEKNPEEPKTLP